MLRRLMESWSSSLLKWREARLDRRGLLGGKALFLLELALVVAVAKGEHRRKVDVAREELERPPRGPRRRSNDVVDIL